MANITSTGIGSGLDVNGLLEQLVTAEREPVELRLNRLEASYTAELTALGSFKSGLSTFQNSLSSLKLESTFNSKSTSVINENLLSISTTSSIAQSGTYNLEVTSLAQSQSLASVAVNELTDVIGTGTLKFRFGTTDYVAATDTYNSFTENTTSTAQSIIIDSSNNTIDGIRDAVNGAEIGVTASIVNDGSGYRLLLVPEQQGLDNSLEVTVDEGAAAADNLDTVGLSQLAFNIDATNMEQTQAAQDAEIQVNGLQIFREQNIISDAISGVTLNLLSADPGKPTQLTIIDDSSQVEAKITDFVNSYNEMVSTLDSLSKLNTKTGEAGVLLGDSTSQTIMRQIRSALVKSVNTGGSFNSLSSIGISTQRDGSLKIDTNILSSAIQSDADSVAKIFYAAGVPDSSQVKYISSNNFTQEGEYSINISQLATQATLSGASVSGAITIDSTNDSLGLKVDGISSTTVSLTQATYTDMSLLAQEIENRINASAELQAAGAGVSVVFDTDRFIVNSNTYGSDSRVTIDFQNSSLGFTQDATATLGSNIAGNIGSSPAIGSGRQLSGTGEATGILLDISATQTGGLGSLSFSRGLAGNLDTLISQYLADDGQLTAKIDRVTGDIADIGADRIELDKRVTGIEARYRKQFTALDLLVSQLNSTSNFLQQQLDNISSFTNGKK